VTARRFANRHLCQERYAKIGPTFKVAPVLAHLQAVFEPECLVLLMSCFGRRGTAHLGLLMSHAGPGRCRSDETSIRFVP